MKREAKGKTSTLTAVRADTVTMQWKDALMLFFSAVLLLTGLWETAIKALGLDVYHVSLPLVMALGMPFLLGALFFRREVKWQRAVLAAVCVIAVMACAAGWHGLREGAAAYMDRLAVFLTRKTGYLYFGYAAGDAGEFTCLLAAVSGALAGIFVRVSRSLWYACGMLLLCVPYIAGFLEADAWFGLWAAGMLVLLVYEGRQWLMAIPLILVIAAIVSVPVFTGALAENDHETAAREMLHHWRYEKAENPLPEGVLKNLSAFTPDDAPAMDVTMTHWTALYLRGFAGERYTSEGWESLDKAAVAEEAALLYSLQKSYFFPQTQLAAAGRAADVTADNKVTVKRRDACAAYDYLPYGADGSELLDARRLAGKGMGLDAYETVVYPVSDSYMVQEELVNKKSAAEDYLDGEEAYRTWVYEHYTALPEETYALLSDTFPVDSTSLTTTEAKMKITSWLSAALTYDEEAVGGEEDTIRYLLEFDGRGYSAHYATMATLLMRACGIPARYVEGYLVPASAAETLSDGETLELTQRYAHAWTEYYLDGVGWLPFDASPGHTEEIHYRLPSNGMEGEDGDLPAGAGDLEVKLPERELKVEIEGSLGEDSGVDWVLNVAKVLAILALLVLAALAARIVWLRRKLRRRVAGFQSLPAREGAADCFHYIGTVLLSCGLPRENLPVTKQTAAIAEVLKLTDRREAEAAVRLAGEAWFSAHEVTETQRKQALDYLDRVMRIWKKETPALRRFQDKWLKCKIY